MGDLSQMAAELDEIAAAPAFNPRVSVLRPRAALCVVRDARFVEPCAKLALAPFQLAQLIDPSTRQPSRSFVGVWSGDALVPLGVCPFCGTPIGATP